MLGLARHFAIQYAALGFLGLILGLASRSNGWAGAAVSALIMNAWTVAPLWTTEPGTGGGSSLRIVSYNLHTQNREHNRSTEWLARSRADVLALVEVDEAWLDSLRTELEGYVLVASEPHDDNFGMAVFVSKEQEKRWRGSVRAGIGAADGIPTLELRPRGGAGGIALLVMHAMPPVSEAAVARQRRQFEEAGRWAQAQRSNEWVPVIVGDLNATPFVEELAYLRRAGGLSDSSWGHGFQGTFPAPWWAWPARIPIDHVLHDASVVAIEREIGPDLGSDHRPLIVELAPRIIR
jgi:endonuclease/exonuclease/phosphatase (EEP) superfamily protein YafD